MNYHDKLKVALVSHLWLELVSAHPFPFVCPSDPPSTFSPQFEDVYCIHAHPPRLFYKELNVLRPFLKQFLSHVRVLGYHDQRPMKKKTEYTIKPTKLKITNIKRYYVQQIIKRYLCNCIMV